LLQNISGLDEVGYYGASLQIGGLGFVVTSAMIPIINREFAYHQGTNDTRQIRYLFNKYIPMFFSLSALISIYVAFQADNIIGLFLDDRYASAYIPLILLSFFFIYLSYTRIIETILLSFQKTQKYRDIGLIYNILGVALTFLFVFLFELGATGLAIKMLLTQFIGSSIILYFSAKVIDINARSIFKQQAISICMLLLIGYLATLLTPQLKFYLLNLLTYGVIYLALIILTTYFYPNLFSFTRRDIDAQILKIKQKLI
jgi:O-antigen/teichoic acid export membrane protein